MSTQLSSASLLIFLSHHLDSPKSLPLKLCVGKHDALNFLLGSSVDPLFPFRKAYHLHRHRGLTPDDVILAGYSPTLNVDSCCPGNRAIGI